MPRPDMDMDALLTVGEAAAFLRMPKQRINRWRELGHLAPADTSGGVRRYRLGDVLKAERATRHSKFSNRAA